MHGKEKDVLRQIKELLCLHQQTAHCENLDKLAKRKNLYANSCETENYETLQNSYLQNLVKLAKQT